MELQRSVVYPFRSLVLCCFCNWSQTKEKTFFVIFCRLPTLIFQIQYWCYGLTKLFKYLNTKEIWSLLNWISRGKILKYSFSKQIVASWKQWRWILDEIYKLTGMSCLIEAYHAPKYKQHARFSSSMTPASSWWSKKLSAQNLLPAHCLPNLLEYFFHTGS